MTDTNVLEIATQTLIVAAKLCAPILITSLAIGVFVSLIQSVTQVQEFTLSFVPKLAGVGLVILLAGHWMLTTLEAFTLDLFHMIPDLIK